MRERWRTIAGFDTYEISNLGNVRNTETDRGLRLARNQRGIVYVGLMQRGVQYKRSVALLVAAAFLNPPGQESFDSVIHLDGVRDNCQSYNLMWRPQSFANRYMNQLQTVEPVIPHQIISPTTNEAFKDSREMAIKYGLLQTDILYSVVNGQMIWPTRLFAVVNDL